MSLTTRKYFYQETTVDGNKELDYLQAPLEQMNFTTQEFYTVDAATQDRIDLISFKYYGNYNLGWLIAEHNDILDPITQIKIGKVLRIPALDEYYQYYNRNTRSPTDG